MLNSTKYLLIAILLIIVSYPLIGSKLHLACLRIFSTYQGHYEQEKKALICGATLTGTKKRSLLVRSGLIHIFVVSGAHIQFYKNIFHFIFGSNIASALISVLLPIYCLVCNGSAPILRACSFYFLQIVDNNLKVKLPKTELSFIAGLLCLLFNIKNIFSISLILSWTCSLIIQTHQLKEKTFYLHLIMAPILLLFCIPNPIVIIPSFLLATLVSFIILPVTFLSVLYPDTFNLFFNYLYKFLEFFTREIKVISLNNSQSDSLLLSLIWVYLILINFFLIQKELKQ